MEDWREVVEIAAQGQKAIATLDAVRAVIMHTANYENAYEAIRAIVFQQEDK